MGEAKRRIQHDTFYGKMPKKGFGLVISSPVQIVGGNIHASELDAQELRFSLLFWDRLAWPTNSFITFGNDDADFLEKEGILIRPHVHMTGPISSIVEQSHIQAFRNLANAEPGLWSLSQGKNSILLEGKDFAPRGGTEFDLYQAIPVPTQDVPLADILDFRRRRRDELLRLRLEIDSLFTKMTKGGDEAGFTRAITEIDACCVDVLKVANETHFPLRFVDLKQHYSLDLMKILGPALMAFAAADHIGLGLTSALAAALGGAKLGGASAKVEFGGLMWKPNPVTSHPFRYVSSYHKEVFNQ